MKRGGMPTWMMWLILIAVLTGFVLVIALNVIAPTIRFALFNSCWADFASSAGRFNIEPWKYADDLKYKNSSIKIGDCVMELAFVNNDTWATLEGTVRYLAQLEYVGEGVPGSEVFTLTEEIFDQIECGKGPGYMIGIPLFGDRVDLGGGTLWFITGGLLGYYGGGVIPASKAITIKKLSPARVFTGLKAAMGAKSIHDWASDTLRSFEKAGKEPFCLTFENHFTHGNITNISAPGDYCLVLIERDEKELNKDYNGDGKADAIFNELFIYNKACGDLKKIPVLEQAGVIT